MSIDLSKRGCFPARRRDRALRVLLALAAEGRESVSKPCGTSATEEETGRQRAEGRDESNGETKELIGRSPGREALEESPPREGDPMGCGLLNEPITRVMVLNSFQYFAAAVAVRIGVPTGTPIRGKRQLPLSW